MEKNLARFKHKYINNKKLSGKFRLGDEAQLTKKNKNKIKRLGRTVSENCIQRQEHSLSRTCPEAGPLNPTPVIKLKFTSAYQAAYSRYDNDSKPGTT